MPWAPGLLGWGFMAVTCVLLGVWTLLRRRRPRGRAGSRARDRAGALRLDIPDPHPGPDAPSDRVLTRSMPA